MSTMFTIAMMGSEPEEPTTLALGKVLCGQSSVFLNN